LLAGALERGERAGAGALVLVQRAGNGQLAGAAMVAVAGAPGGRALALLLALLLGPLRLGTRDRRELARRGRRRSAARGRRLFGRLRRLGGFRGRGSFGRLGGLLPGAPVLLGATLLFLDSLQPLLLLAAARFLGQPQPLFLGLALQAGDALLRRLAGRSRLAHGRRRRRSSHRRRRGCRRRRGGLAGLADDAAALDLDDHLVGAAVAEGLLDLAGIDRTLEAERLAFARGVGGVAHKTRFVLQIQSAVARYRYAGMPSVTAARRPPRKCSRRRSGMATRSADARSASARWTTLSRPNATDKA